MRTNGSLVLVGELLVHILQMGKGNQSQFFENRKFRTASLKGRSTHGQRIIMLFLRTWFIKEVFPTL